jgi:hypothetical protein
MQLTPSEWNAWWSDPCTQGFLLLLHSKMQETKDAWAQQAYVDTENESRSARLNLYALAGVDILGQVIDLVEEKRPQHREQEDASS